MKWCPERTVQLKTAHETFEYTTHACTQKAAIRRGINLLQTLPRDEHDNVILPGTIVAQIEREQDGETYIVYSPISWANINAVVGYVDETGKVIIKQPDEIGSLNVFPPDNFQSPLRRVQTEG